VLVEVGIDIAVHAKRNRMIDARIRCAGATTAQTFSHRSGRKLCCGELMSNIPRQEFLDPIGRMLRDVAQDVLQIGLRVQAAQFCAGTHMWLGAVR
jgi:hypothetical protein